MMDFKIFQKPQRYIGNEWNAIKKSNYYKKIKICISYPDLYEVGMSNLGIRIIYGILNSFSDVVCERVFMPGNDLISFLKKTKRKLFSLETKTPLDEFEIIGFNFNYELNFTNFLHILDLGGIPLKTKERRNIIVIGGGVANPEPLADFVDLFLLGEFEEIAEDFVKVLRQYKDKESRLKLLSQKEGFYIPKFYSFFFYKDNYIFEKKYPYAKFPLKRVYVKDLNKSFYPLKWLTPYTSIVHDRAQIEIARGCPNRCTFCQARSIYYPYRERKVSTIKEIIKKIYESSGYENFSFLALSASDYSSLEALIEETIDYFKEKRIGLSLPSLRVKDIIGKLYRKLSLLKKTSLTVAIEAARGSLREKLNKRLRLEELFEAAKIIRTLKIKHIKIYFMFGLPEEEEQDLIAIGNLLDKLSKESKLNLNISINIFIPKPFSLWEGINMQGEEILKNKRKLILKNIPRQRSIKISLSYLKKSILEAVISRGDRRISKVIYRAYLKGARLDGYREGFCWKIWEDSFKEEEIDYHFYLSKNTKNFPWSFIM
ncbi:MAG TPA: TIGR03960 family B12-binding radical SAM protein [Candidatus Omnitrophica bacterium]|nr:TIGR03960 family B12-binding radical SAM protein [Candidatus Omnitrophota bacterium]